VSLGEDIAAALPGLRAQAESLMTEPCTIRRPIGNDTDPLTGESVPAYRTPDVYAGPCKVQDAGNQAREVESGSSTATLTSLEVHIPVSAEAVAAGDFIEVGGRKFRADRPHRKTWQTAQRIPVTEVEGLV